MIRLITVKEIIFIYLLFFGTDCFSAKVQTQVEIGQAVLFNKLHFINWIISNGGNGYWKVINHDAESKALGDKHFCTKKENKDFVLFVNCRIKETALIFTHIPIIFPNSSLRLDENGKIVRMTIPVPVSEILLHDSDSKCLVNIWCWSVNSCNIYSYNANTNMSLVKLSMMPKANASINIGEWNIFKITHEKDFLTVELNEKIVVENAFWLSYLKKV